LEPDPPDPLESLPAATELGPEGLSEAALRIEGSRPTGLLASEGELTDVSIADCRLDLAAFAQATIEHARIVDCDLRGSSWQAAVLREVSFEDCDLSEAG